MATTKIKSTHPESQGDFVEIEEADFDPKIHELYEPAKRGRSAKAPDDEPAVPADDQTDEQA
jgi:hypothetical protein